MRLLVEVDLDDGGYSWATYHPETEELYEAGRSALWGTALALAMHRGVRVCIEEFGPELGPMIDHLAKAGTEAFQPRKGGDGDGEAGTDAPTWG
jgi:hypothetical protein